MNQSPYFDTLLQLLLLAGFIIPAILFLMSEQRTLAAIKPANRSIEPGLVWLQLIPLFGQVYQFIVVTKLSRSIELALNTRPGEGNDLLREPVKRPLYAIGIAYCTLFCAGILCPVRLLKIWFMLPCMICWIIFWVQLARYKKMINAAY